MVKESWQTSGLSDLRKTNKQTNKNKTNKNTFLVPFICQSIDYIQLFQQILTNSLEEFYQHVVLAYAENFFVITSYLWPPESKSGWCKCVHVERSEIWVKKAIFWSKHMFSAFCEVFTHFSLSIRIDNNFLIIIAGDSTTYLLLSVYFKSKMWIFSIFG